MLASLGFGLDAHLDGPFVQVVPALDLWRFQQQGFQHLVGGDSLCGFMTHFGNQATTANLGIFAGLVEGDKRKPLVVSCDGTDYDLGKPKMGICMGDFCQVGCNSVSDPATFLKPYTIVYALTRITKGFYGPNEVLKNKPMEHGIIERAGFKSM